MSDEEIIEVVKAHKEGKRLQHILKNPIYGQPEKWTDIPNSGWMWNFLERDYRVAPEPRKPREWKVALHKDGGIWSPHSGTTGTDYTWIRVREVIE